MQLSQVANEEAVPFIEDFQLNMEYDENGKRKNLHARPKIAIFSAAAGCFFLSFAVKRQEKPSLLACYCRILALFYQARFSKKTLRKALISI